MLTETKPIPSARPLPHCRSTAELEALLDRQGVRKTANIEHLMGCGEHLWASDEELDAFLKLIDEAGLPGD